MSVIERTMIQIENSDLDVYEFRVFCRILLNRKDDLYQESVETAANAMQISAQKVRYCLKSLKEKGYIEQIQTGGGLHLSTYRILQPSTPTQKVSKARPLASDFGSSL